MRDAHDDDQANGRRRELRLFLFLIVVLFPALAVALVGSYGLAVWIFQTLTGSPA